MLLFNYRVKRKQLSPLGLPVFMHFQKTNQQKQMSERSFDRRIADDMLEAKEKHGALCLFKSLECSCVKTCNNNLQFLLLAFDETRLLINMNKTLNVSHQTTRWYNGRNLLPSMMLVTIKCVLNYCRSVYALIVLNLSSVRLFSNIIRFKLLRKTINKTDTSPVN